MCNILHPIMDNYQGDLSDIIRASGASYGSCSMGTSSSKACAPFSLDHWQFSSVLEGFDGNFGDPFSNTRDPFLHQLELPACFNSATSSAEISSSGALEEATFFGGGVAASTSSSRNSCVLKETIFEDDGTRRPCNSILANMTQISPPNDKLPMSPLVESLSRALKPSGVVFGDTMINVKTSEDDCLVGNNNTKEMQISPPQNPCLKRRKSLAKKSICVPAPAAPNSRQSGEVVPSDLWAWRKYGQKPIKGSPYPRGYYRCSSSKGCPARKQVERSRTDPNLLVITYTSEHNHPWPTHRNSLAGSSRSQPSSKGNNFGASKNAETSPQNDEEQQEESNSDSNNVNNSACVQEDGDFSDIGLPYKPISNIKSYQQQQLDQGLFAEFAEIEKAQSLNLMSPPQGLDDHQMKSNALDSFHIFDWSADNTTDFHLI
ncbi:probable WRKY transcription factor 35 [Vigna radiata var. radiata]|uniref:Probable WRKY transcription factor 35 n=1 Tax=Vigna radiata var. radiata TaxID=3916 RepID=A0A1S3T8M4_VIGRR|nr:probable WRKY transcription factor 35 [Vigna radiata var. radiata]